VWEAGLQKRTREGMTLGSKCTKADPANIGKMAVQKGSRMKMKKQISSFGVGRKGGEARERI